MNPAAEYQSLKDEIDDALRRVLTSGRFIGGPEVEGFESELATFVDADHVVGVGNGTDALEIALAACGIGAGHNVAVPAFTFAATIEAVVRCGATPLILDVADRDLTIDVGTLGAALRDGLAIDAVIPVHLYGQPAEMEALLGLRAEHGFKIVEDAAQAQGARCRLNGRLARVGALGDAGCFSFYPTKNLAAAGDAGAIATNDPAIAARARLIANHGDASKYEHVLSDGRNSRLDAIQAAILRIKLRHLDTWNDNRRRIAALYSERLADSGLDSRLPSERSGSECVFHQYALRLGERDRVLEALHESGVAAAVHYPRALHQQQGFASYAPQSRLPVSEDAAGSVLCLPIHPLMGAEHVETNCDAVVRAAGT